MVVNYRWSFEVTTHDGHVAVFHTDPGSFSKLLEGSSESFSAAVDNAAREYLVSTFGVSVPVDLSNYYISLILNETCIFCLTC